MALKDFWYIAAESRELRGRPLARALFGEPIVLFRDGAGAAAAFEDRCAHRNMALSLGRCAAGGIECAYHGWRYDAAGRCAHVPAAGEGAKLPRVSVRAYPAVEQDGYVWVWAGAGPAQGRPWRFAQMAEPGWTHFTMQNLFEGTVEACLENFLDCPHTVFVHKGLFRTADPRPLSAAIRRGPDFAEARFADEPISPSLVSYLLFPKGRELKHTDRFLMPNISRVDYSFGPDRHFIIMSQCTPVSERVSRVYTVVNYRFGRVGGLVRLFFEPLCRRIIAQDVTVIKRQSDSIARFGAEKFTHLATDLLGLHISQMRADCERGASPAAGAETEREVTIRF